MTDSLERFLQDLRFEVPAGLVDRAKAAADANAAGAQQSVRRKNSQARRTAHRDRGEVERQPWFLAVVAMLLAVAIVATLVGVRALHLSTPSPAKHGPSAGLHHNGWIVTGIGNALFAIEPDTVSPNKLYPDQRAILSVPTDPTCASATQRSYPSAGACVTVSDASYSSDGTRLAYLKTAGFGVTEPSIWIFNIATAKNQLLVTCHAPGCGRFSHVAWSPEGSRLAFSDADTQGQLQIYVIDADGTHRAQLTHFSAGENATQPTWSPNGNRIAFTVSTGPFGQSLNCDYSCGSLAPPSSIDVINTDGSGLTVLLSGVRQQDGAGDLDPSWSPDGSRIAYSFALPAEGGPPLVTEYQLWLMDPDGSHRTKIFKTETESGGHDPGGPAWSPDGTRIAVSGFGGPCFQGCAYELYVMNADGSHPRDIGNVVWGDHPAWEPVS